MASPPEVNIKTLTGKYAMNKTMSDDVDPLVQLQGLGWFLRKTLKVTRVTVHLVQEASRIDIQNYLSGGWQIEPDYRVFDWKEYDKKDKYFGDLKNKARYTRIEDIPRGEGPEELNQKDLDYINGAAWDEAEDKLHVQVINRNDDAGWLVHQIWGFEMIDEIRYHVHRIILKKGSTTMYARVVYDWLGSIQD